MASNPLQEQKLLDARLRRFQERLGGLIGVSATRKGQQIELRISPAEARVTAWELAAALRSENPMIVVWDHLAEAGLISVTLSKVSDETAEFVAGRIAEICAHAKGGGHGSAPNITDRVLVELETWPTKARSAGRN